jgi:hypothetical protein
LERSIGVRIAGGSKTVGESEVASAPSLGPVLDPLFSASPEGLEELAVGSVDMDFTALPALGAPGLGDFLAKVFKDAVQAHKKWVGQGTDHALLLALANVRWTGRYLAHVATQARKAGKPPEAKRYSDMGADLLDRWCAMAETWRRRQGLPFGAMDRQGR